ncbi:MAG: hypothetical protein ABSA83_22350 [Verrucomicrobiota bacterium]|jgi:hypothetical protein
MKKMLHFTIAGLAWLAVLATPLARAWTYSDGDVLLIFRETGSSDVEFDIGNVSQFLGHSSPYAVQVTDWSLSLVNSTFGSVSGASVILIATTSGTATWITSSGTVNSVSDVTYTGQNALYSHINGIGVDPVNDNEDTTGANSYVIQESGDTAGGHSSNASYYWIVTDDGVAGAYIANFGGNLPFDVEGVAPATLGFWQIQPTGTNPKPEATYIGTFDIDVNGNLFFYVGSIQPTITAVTQTGAADKVSFTTLLNGSYSLVYTTDLTVPVSQWTPVAGITPVTGNGGTRSFSFTSPGDNADYFAVVRSP